MVQRGWERGAPWSGDLPAGSRSPRCSAWLQLGTPRAYLLLSPGLTGGVFPPVSPQICARPGQPGARTHLPGAGAVLAEHRLFNKTCEWQHAAAAPLALVIISYPPLSQAVLAALLTELAPCPLQPWQSRRAPRGVLGVPVSPPLRCTASPPSLLDPSQRCGSNPWARMQATWRITPQEKPTAWPPRCPLGATQLLPGGLLGGAACPKTGHEGRAPPPGFARGQKRPAAGANPRGEPSSCPLRV